MDFEDSEDAKDAARGRYGVWCEAVTCVLMGDPLSQLGNEPEPAFAQRVAGFAIAVGDAVLAAFDKRFPEVKESSGS